ncbi:alginate lyase family protein [Microbulbifer sp. GL-2]|uniref:alginate lyase family protein n=1 Tax=Microbulbifer sp. GL-2 TaxID=2591606 RepID=UPI0011630701|nr:alginate lyase family protein [Microbulbifer sp. GL-2]BBM03889.1 hypothetical protein GL2_39630 [Microbulbifer sp. GL-2]
MPLNRIRPAPTADNSISSNGSQLSKEPDTFVLYRIIGNDLVPRHEKGQSRKNLKFILENEPKLLACEKRFVLNRIIDHDEEQRIIDMLEEAGVPYVRIPFEWNEYKQKKLDIEGVPLAYAPYSAQYNRLSKYSQAQIRMRLLRFKNNYVINNNGARNLALKDGRNRAKWILPWDGNCFLTASAWDAVRRSVISNYKIPYHIVPMARVTNNQDLLDKNFTPEPVEEPQILFRRDAREEFNDSFYYGRRSKIELFWRLGVPGKWDFWPIEPWDLDCPNYSPDVGQFNSAGWVARLYSGKQHLEKAGSNVSWMKRSEARMEAVTNLLLGLDFKSLSSNSIIGKQIFSEKGMDQSGCDSLKVFLRSSANKALERGPQSVVHKKTLPPSNNRRDYWHPAPYYWPHPFRIPGLPYVRRDGQRVPGTHLYDPRSDDYDRTRLQHLFDDTYILALGLLKFDEYNYGRHAAELVKNWFLDSQMSMNPHLQYAQVRRGHNKNKGSSAGIIEFKDLYYFFDAVRILHNYKCISDYDLKNLKIWMGKYLNWLCVSDQGKGERSASNNHGTYYDLQVASICLFLDDYKLLHDTFRNSRFRILEQFEADGSQPKELKRSASAHYCCFNLQGWIHLAQIAESVGEDLWGFTGRDGRGLRKGMEWFLYYSNKHWPYEQINAFDKERFLPIYFSYLERFGALPVDFNLELPCIKDVKPIFFPHDGIRPFWNLDILNGSLVECFSKSFKVAKI